MEFKNMTLARLKHEQAGLLRDLEMIELTGTDGLKSALLGDLREIEVQIARKNARIVRDSATYRQLFA